MLGHAAVLGFAHRQGEATLQAFGSACRHLEALDARHLMKLVEAASQQQDIPKAQIQVRGRAAGGWACARECWAPVC